MGVEIVQDKSKIMNSNFYSRVTHGLKESRGKGQRLYLKKGQKIKYYSHYIKFQDKTLILA